MWFSLVSKLFFLHVLLAVSMSLASSSAEAVCNQKGFAAAMLMKALGNSGVAVVGAIICLCLLLATGNDVSDDYYCYGYRCGFECCCCFIAIILTNFPVFASLRDGCWRRCGCKADRKSNAAIVVSGYRLSWVYRQ